MMYDADLIKKVIYDTIPAELIEQIMVFGSRARNEATKDSDTDICIIFKDEISREDNIKYHACVSWAFGFTNRMATDIVMKSKCDYNRYKSVIGGIEHSIAKEGVAI